jgi:hypothetical protein
MLLEGIQWKRRHPTTLTGLLKATGLRTMILLSALDLG